MIPQNRDTEETGSRERRNGNNADDDRSQDQESDLPTLDDDRLQNELRDLHGLDNEKDADNDHVQDQEDSLPDPNARNDDLRNRLQILTSQMNNLPAGQSFSNTDVAKMLADLLAKEARDA